MNDRWREDERPPVSREARNGREPSAEGRVGKGVRTEIGQSDLESHGLMLPPALFRRVGLEYVS